MPADVLFCCVTEPEKKFLEQSARLLMSLRWFGGSVAQCHFVLGCTGSVPAEAAALFHRYRAEIISVRSYDTRHGPSNKIALLASPELAGCEFVVLLDCDTLIVQDPSTWLEPIGISAKTADLPTVSDNQLNEIFRFCAREPPPPLYVHELTGDACKAYCNSGVIIIREQHRRVFAAAWDRWNRLLLENSSLEFNRFHTDQVSLAVAIDELGITFEPLPSEMNMPVHLEAHRYPLDWDSRDPIIIHYHWMAYPNGYIKSPRLRQAARRIATFNSRLRAECGVSLDQKLTDAGVHGHTVAKQKVIVGSGWWCDAAPHQWAIGSPATRSHLFFDLWYRQVIASLQPDRIAIIDSNSPVKPDYWAYDGIEWIALDENYGHPNDVRVGKIRTKYSGFTKSVIASAMYALCCDADFFVYVEQDCLLHGDNLLHHAIGNTTEDILLGPPTSHGRGLNGAVAAPMLQQSLMIVRKTGLERFLTGLLSSPFSDGELSPEEIMRIQLNPGIIQIPFGRSRPIDFGRSHFYAQHLTDDELSSFLQRIGAKVLIEGFGLN